LDWKGLEELQEERVASAFEAVFQETMQKFLPGGLPEPQFIWSSASAADKGSLHVICKLPGWCWESMPAQKAFWKHVQRDVLSDQVDGLITPDGKCVIDTAVYTKNRAWRIIGSHKHGSDRVLKPYGEPHTYRDHFVTVEKAAEHLHCEFPTVEVVTPKNVAASSSSLTELAEELVPNARVVAVDGKQIKMRTVGERPPASLMASATQATIATAWRGAMGSTLAALMRAAAGKSFAWLNSPTSKATLPAVTRA
jgi:hypothetical protein